MPKEPFTTICVALTSAETPVSAATLLMALTIASALSSATRYDTPSLTVAPTLTLFSFRSPSVRSDVTLPLTRLATFPSAVARASEMENLIV
ncbi:MAG: hypothetical protein BWZ10_01873 [candidate division BRC1 bacterium ADurb.BinA364]|nr:MAG: hypothetical protein BWZ10_01873 [candidate division BRC1 bacterium ADurb.BinA364]